LNLVRLAIGKLVPTGSGVKEGRMRKPQFALAAFVLALPGLVVVTYEMRVSGTAAEIAVPSAVQEPAEPTVKEIEITAKKYEYSMENIEVPLNTTLRLKITALDREHGFEIEGVKDSCVDIPKGETRTVEYHATKVGTFKFKCCHFCGLGHGGMKGAIT
jgi:heme/copper-type cytochrome/quinol oxidase subunit 2